MKETNNKPGASFVKCWMVHRRFGPANPKVTKDQMLEIGKEKRGSSRKATAKKYGISLDHVTMIRALYQQQGEAPFVNKSRRLNEIKDSIAAAKADELYWKSLEGD